jgi:prepilin-type N-terminal cleavage/methylation domain-containing protein
MKLTQKNTLKGFTLVELLVVIAIIAALAAMATPVILKQKKKADMTEAVNNAKQIFYLMIEFDGDFGEFPSDASSADIDTTGTGITLGTSTSNDFFKQFIAGGYTKSEEIFYAKSTITKKPDNVLKGDALEAGECGFAYVANQSTSVNSGRPLVMAPMEESGEFFNPDPYDNKAVVLRIDGSVKQLRVNQAKKAVLTGADTLFDTGEDTVWGSDGYESGNLKKALPK